MAAGDSYLNRVRVQITRSDSKGTTILQSTITEDAWKIIKADPRNRVFQLGADPEDGHIVYISHENEHLHVTLQQIP